MTLHVAPLVEGQTEAGCIERLLWRVWNELIAAPIRLRVLPPTRCRRDSFIAPGHAELSNKIEEAHIKLAHSIRREADARGLLLVLLDAEGDCPASLGPRLLADALAARKDADVACVLAKRMFENWIVGGASTLAGVNGLPDVLPVRDRFEEIHGAGWLGDRLRQKDRGRKYKKTADAEAFVRAMDLVECRANCPSFDKLCRELHRRNPIPGEPPA